MLILLEFDIQICWSSSTFQSIAWWRWEVFPLGRQIWLPKWPC